MIHAIGGEVASWGMALPVHADPKEDRFDQLDDMVSTTSNSRNRTRGLSEPDRLGRLSSISAER